MKVSVSQLGHAVHNQGEEYLECHNNAPCSKETGSNYWYGKPTGPLSSGFIDDPGNGDLESQKASKTLCASPHQLTRETRRVEMAGTAKYSFDQDDCPSHDNFQSCQTAKCKHITNLQKTMQQTQRNAKRRCTVTVRVTIPMLPLKASRRSPIRTCNTAHTAICVVGCWNTPSSKHSPKTVPQPYRDNRADCVRATYESPTTVRPQKQEK